MKSTVLGHVYGGDGVTPVPNLHIYAVDTTTYQGTPSTFTEAYGSCAPEVPTGNYVVKAKLSQTGLEYAGLA